MANLKLSDIDILREIIHSKTIKEAAERLKIERTLIYRVFRNAEKYIGLDKWQWRKDGVPPEIVRIVQSVDENLIVQKQFPKISIGYSLSLFLILYCQRCGLDLTRIRHLRSNDISDALTSFSIDLAFNHRFLEEPPGEDLPDSILQKDLVKWEAVVVAPKKPSAETFPVSWFEDSFADKLTKATGLPNYQSVDRNPIHEPVRYRDILELIRRGYQRQVIIPDIFLIPEDYKLIKVSKPQNKTLGVFLAQYRQQDYKRIKPWINAKIWEKIFNQN